MSTNLERVQRDIEKRERRVRVGAITIGVVLVLGYLWFSHLSPTARAHKSMCSNLTEFYMAAFTNDLNGDEASKTRAQNAWNEAFATASERGKGDDFATDIKVLDSLGVTASRAHAVMNKNCS